MCPGVDVLLQQQKEGIEYHSTSPRYRDHKNISPDEHEIRDNLCACSMASLLSSSHAFGLLAPRRDAAVIQLLWSRGA